MFTDAAVDTPGSKSVWEMYKDKAGVSGKHVTFIENSKSKHCELSSKGLFKKILLMK